MFQRWLIASGLALATVAVPFSVQAVQVRSMPPAAVESSKAGVSHQFLGAALAAHRINASAWNDPRLELQKASQTAGAIDRSKAAQIGYPRAIASLAQQIPMTSLTWQTLSDSSRVARVEVTAQDAAGLRVAYRVGGPVDAMKLRFAGDGRDEVYLGDTHADGALTWSPVLEGSVATVEIHLAAGFAPEQFTLRFDSLSHLVKAGASLGQKDTRDIGASDSCNRDVVCGTASNPALAALAKSVVKLVYTDAGSTYTCSGTLINGTAGGNFVYTAAHCIDSQAEAGSLNTYWFFDAGTCGSTAVPPYQLLTGGSLLLSTDTTLDGTLVELAQTPPNGAIRAAWNATVIPTGLALTGMHHPSGDLKKYSLGTMQGYAQGPEAYSTGPRPEAFHDSFITVRWTLGSTEEGSSGSGVFTYNSAGFYELRGGLEGGAASCGNQSGIDRYSRLDLLFTKLAPYISPASVIPASNSAVATMVEYYMPQYDYYFMTSRESEKSSLDTYRDSNGNPWFYRTGYWFKVDPFASSTKSSMSRYFVPGVARGGLRGSHFYTALNTDKQLITNSGKERFAANCAGVPDGFFCNEGIDSYIALPIGTTTATACLSNEQKVFRVFRDNPPFVDDANHRYLTNETMYNYMVADQRWRGEGVAFCAAQ